MKCLQVFTWIVGVLMVLGAAPLKGQLSDSDQKARKIHQSVLKNRTVSDEQFETLHKWLTGNSGSEKWRLIEWRTDLWEARKEAAKQNKPLFIWAMNGNPLGCV